MKHPRMNQKRTDRKKEWKRQQSAHLQNTLAIMFASGLVVPPGHEIDHIVPKEWCFNHGISAQRCASRENIQVVTRKYNMEKGTRLFPESLELIDKWEKEDEKHTNDHQAQ